MFIIGAGKVLAILLVVCSLVMVPCTIGATQPDKEKLALKAQMLHERIQRLRVEISVLIDEHNKTAKEYNAIITILKGQEDKDI